MFLIVAVVTFALEIRSVLAVNGWWLDEYFSLWSTDPSLTFIEAFTQRFKEPKSAALLQRAVLDPPFGR